MVTLPRGRMTISVACKRSAALLVLLGALGCDADPIASPPEYGFDLIFDGALASDETILLRASLGRGSVTPIGGGVVGRHPRSGSDGSTIVYHTLDSAGEYKLKILLPGGLPTELTGGPGVMDREPALSPKGDRLVFTSHRDDEYGDIFVARLQGTTLHDVRNLTPVAGAEMTAAWSPDGTQIAFTSYRSGYPSIWIMSADGENPRPITRGSGTFSDYFPTWSPDGTRLAFQRIGTAESRIGIVRLTASEPTFLDLSQRAYSPAWSPDGAYLAVAADDGDIHVVSPSGGFHLRVGSPGVDRSPAWLPRNSPW